MAREALNGNSWHPVFESVQHPVCLLDTRRQIVRCNNALANLIHRPPETIVGQTCCTLLGCSFNGGPCPAEQTLTGANRCEAQVQIQGRTMRLITDPLLAPDGRPAGCFHLLTDITPLASRIDNAGDTTQDLINLGLMTGVVAHDFNNVLASILAFGELAGMYVADNANAKHCMQEILEAARKGSGLVATLLNRAENRDSKRETLDLCELVGDMLPMIAVRVPPNIRIINELPMKLAPIEAVPSQIRQVMLNVILNAIEAIGARSGNIKLNAALVTCDRAFLDATFLGRGLPEGRYATITITDTGCGVDPAGFARLFDAFTTSKAAAAGHGLGLYAVATFIRQHCGTVAVTSHPGEGTRMQVLLPALGG